jgi:major membrane immunogen (membrane-anchored lipoprotein)
MTTTTRTWAALIAVAFALAACGGDASTSSDATDAATEAATEQAAAPTKDEFIEVALAECQAVNAALDENEPQGDPFAADASEEDREKGLAYLQAAADGFASFSAKLREAGFPEDDPQGAQALADSADQASAAFGDAAAAAEEDMESAGAAVGQAFQSMGPLEQAAEAYGIGNLEDCEREGEPAEEVAEGANEVPVTPVGEDGRYDFEFDQPVPAGQTAFVLDNTDDEAHFMFVVRITGEKSLDEILQAEQDGENPEQYAEEVGGSDDAAPGEQVVLNADLKPGTYGMLCYIPGPEGEPHAYSGMAVEFAVE